MSAPFAFEMEARTLRLMKFGALERRAGGWRFGTKRIGDQVVARLVAQGRARIDGARCLLVTPDQTP